MPVPVAIALVLPLFHERQACACRAGLEKTEASTRLLAAGLHPDLVCRSDALACCE